MLKIAFGMIVFEGDYVLRQCLEQVYPFASQILIAEGPVKYWQDKGRTTSTDSTNKILEEFPDPDNKITIVHGQFAEKDEQCRAYMPHMKDDIDYIWNLDSDEVYKTEDIETIISLLESEKYTSVGVKSCSFYGGFNHYMTGFEEERDQFLRIFKVYPGATWKTHRPPTIIAPDGVETLPEKHLDSDSLFEKYGIRMYHYSYVFPKQVKNKIEYYKAKVSQDRCIDDYFNTVYLPWTLGEADERIRIETKHNGVHEFIPSVRSNCFTAEFTLEHPEAIENSLEELEDRMFDELDYFSVDRTHVDSWKSSSVFNQQLELNLKELEEKYPPHWNSFISTFKDRDAPKSILDIGCGSGAFYEVCKKEFPEIKYTGIDYAEEAIELAKEFWEDASWKVMDYTELTSDFIQSFDLVYASALFDVLPDGDCVLKFILGLNPHLCYFSRLAVTDQKSHFDVCDAYGIKTYAYHHNQDNLMSIILDNGYNIVSHDVEYNTLNVLLERLVGG